MRRTRPMSFLALCAVMLAADAAAQAPDRLLTLALGDPARRDKEVPVVLDGITDSTTNTIVTPAELAARLKGTRLLLLGETHTSLEAHRVQLRTIQTLYAAGRRVVIGLEMYPYTEQQSLDQWVDGLLTEPGFVQLSRWYHNWGYHWHYYREIFLFARDHRIPLVAVNTPREVVTAVRKKGFANLTPEEAAHIPPDGVAADDADHMTFFKASFEEGDALHGGMSDDAWKAMLAAQATWDASMGWNAVKALEKQNDPNAIMTVLVGSGHVAYGLGIARQARRWFDGGIATLIPVPVAMPEHAKTIERVRASYADYVWGVMPEEGSTFPTLGLSTRGGSNGRRVVIQVEEKSVAERAGFALNDELVSMDGEPISDLGSLNVRMARKAWGDAATFVVKRGDEEKTLTAYFRRTLSAPADSQAATQKPSPKP